MALTPRADGRQIHPGFLLNDVEAISLGLWLWRWDLVKNQLSFNQGWEELIGYAAGTLKAEIGLFNRLCHPDDQGSVLKNVERLLKGDAQTYRSEHRLRTRQGEWRWFEDHGRVTDLNSDGTPSVIAGVRTDISDRKAAEARAAELKTHQQFFSASNAAAFWIRDLEGNLTFSDAEVAASFGLPAELSGEEARRRPVHPDDRENMAAAWNKAASETEPFECEHRMLMADGQYRWVLAKAFPVFGADGHVTRWLGATNIIHDRKMAELELKESAEHLQTVIDTVPDAVVIMGEDGQILSFSAGATKVFGFKSEEVVGRSLAVLMPKHHGKAHTAKLKTYGQRSESAVVGHTRLLEGRKKSGVRFPAEVHVSEARRRGSLVFSGYIRDLTEERRAQTRLQQLQEELALTARANALTAMGSAIAHEMNQPLAAAANYLAALRRTWTVESGDAGDMLEGAAQQIDRAASILKRLRDFVTRGTSSKHHTLDPATIDEACALAFIGPHAAVRLEKRVAGDLLPTQVDRVQIQQVIFNILRNAAEALADMNDPRVVLTAKNDANGVLIRIEDNGPGLTKKRRHHLFEPFRSSKPDGMGVGLAICHTLLEGHGGTIKAGESDLGGALFDIRLPAQPARPDGFV